MNRDLRQAGKEGARALATEGQKAQTSISGIGRAGVGSFKAIRQANRMTLADKNPDQSSDWLSSEAQRLAHHETGLTASGLPIDGANSWAAGVAGRAVSAGMATQAANERLQAMMTQSSPTNWMSVQAQRLTGSSSLEQGGDQPSINGMIGTGGVNGLNSAISRLEGVLNRPFVLR